MVSLIDSDAAPPKKKPKAAKADENQRVLTLTAMFSQDRVCNNYNYTWFSVSFKQTSVFSATIHNQKL